MGGQVIIEGNDRGYRRLIEAVRSAGDRAYALRVPKKIGPDPYQGFVARLRIEERDAPLTLRLNDEELEITGSRENLDLFAGNLEFFREDSRSAPSGYHLHIDYIEGDRHIHPSSVPLILYRREWAEERRRGRR